MGCRLQSAGAGACSGFEVQRFHIFVATKPGECVLVDQMISTQVGFIAQLKGKLTRDRYKAATIFVFVHLMRDLTSEETINAKLAFEEYACDHERREEELEEQEEEEEEEEEEMEMEMEMEEQEEEEEEEEEEDKMEEMEEEMEEARNCQLVLLCWPGPRPHCTRWHQLASPPLLARSTACHV